MQNAFYWLCNYILQSYKVVYGLIQCHLIHGVYSAWKSQVMQSEAFVFSSPTLGTFRGPLCLDKTRNSSPQNRHHADQCVIAYSLIKAMGEQNVNPFLVAFSRFKK